jgi:hypothetical protein
LLCFEFFNSTLLAQPNEEAPSSFWRTELPGGSVVLSRTGITTIARSRYLVDGTVRVHEVSVGTVGSVQTRFYFLEPVTPQSPLGAGQSGLDDLRGRLSEVKTRTGMSEVENEVLKTHPLTTHAHTVEFRLSNIEQLDRLYQHLEGWLIRGGSGNFPLDDAP